MTTYCPRCGAPDHRYSTHYVVIVSAKNRIDSECLCSGHDARSAVHAIGVFLLFAPDAACALYAATWGAPSAKVLEVRDGRWRVVWPDAIVRTA